MPQRSVSYRDAGVDIDQANLAKKKIKVLARKTFTSGVMTDIGLFGGLFRLDKKKYKDPVLVSSVDGVGTKLKVAFAAGIHNTCGKDLVSHCVNDILVQGALPLFFMDYIATGKMDPLTVAQIVEGLAEGCREAQCALLGGETAEMPGFYAEGEYDLAGFIVGVVEKSRILDGKAVRPGQLLLSLPSSGLHTNGYSLARKLLLGKGRFQVGTFLPELQATVGQALLAPHLNYLPVLQPLLEQRLVRAMAHITGGGLTENVPRILPPGCAAHIRLGSWPVLPIFSLLQKLGHIDLPEMLRTFNMGAGMVVILEEKDLSRVAAHLKKQGQAYSMIGEIEKGPAQVVYES